MVKKNDPRFIKKLKESYNPNAVWDAYSAKLIDDNHLKEILDSFKPKRTFWSWLWEW